MARRHAPQVAFPFVRTLVLFALVWTALGFPWLSGAATIPWDAKAHFQPQLAFLASSIRAGELPLWNPHVFAGTPHVADPQSLVFSPPHLLLALFDTASLRAADAVVLGMLAAGGIGILLLFRDRGWHWTGALVAAIAFAYGGSAAWRVQHTGQIISLAWWPVALWAMTRAIDRASWRYGALTGLLAALIVLGRDQVGWLGIWLLVIFALGRWWESGAFFGSVRRSLPAVGAASVAGAAVAIVPFVLTALLSGVSNRPSIDLAGAERGSLHPAALLTAFVANLFGVDGPLADYWGPPSPTWGPVDLFLARNMSALYLGAIPVVAMVWAGLLRGGFKAREIRPFLIALVFLLLYALGRYTPAFAWFFTVMPGADLFRRPADATFHLGAVAAMLGGYGVSRLMRDGLLAPTRERLLLLGLLLAAVLGTAVAVAISKDRIGLALVPLAIGAACLIGAAIALLAAERLSPRYPLLVGLALAGLLTADLALNNRPNESTALPPSVYDVLEPNSRNATLAFLRKKLSENASPDRRDRVELVALGFHWPNAGLVHRLDNTLGYNPIRLGLYTAATGAQDHAALATQRSFAPALPSYRSPLADMLGLRYVATGVPIGDIDKALRPGDLLLVGRTEDGFVYENPRALPRVLFVGEARSADFDAVVKTGRWPGFDPRNTVLLAPQEAGTVKPGSSGTARIVAYGSNSVTVQTESRAGGVLVLNDMWHPWWAVEVDGEERPLLRANVLFRAVAVPSGSRTVRFVFRPFRGAWREIVGKLSGGG